MSDILKTFRLPGFVLRVRDLTDDERARNHSGIAEGRDYYAVDITIKGARKPLTLCVGSPIVMTQGKSWDETAAARSALSFAAEPSCFDEPSEIAWSEQYGEQLTNEAFCHRTLGKDLRQ